MPRALPYLVCCLSALACLGAEAPDSFEAASKLGLAKMQAGEWAAARDAFAQALERTKQRGEKADIELQIGRCLEAEGKSGEAMKAFVNSMRSRFYSASRRRGPVALDEYQRILDVPVTRETAETVIFKALAEIGIARQWRRQGVPARAEAHFLKALEWLRAPEYSNKLLQHRDLREAYLGLAEAHADQFDGAAAQDALRQLFRVPGGPDAQRSVQHRLWTLCRTTGGFEAMRVEVRASLTSPDTTPADRVDVQFQVAYSYIYERRYEDARREFAKLLAMPGITPSQTSEAQLYVAHTFFVARQYAEARPLYERIVRMPEADPACVTTAEARVKAIDALVTEPR